MWPSVDSWACLMSISRGTVQSVETSLEVPQRMLDAIVQSLYTRRLEIKPATVEVLLYIATILKVRDHQLD